MLEALDFLEVIVILEALDFLEVIVILEALDFLEALGSLEPLVFLEALVILVSRATRSGFVQRRAGRLREWLLHFG